MQQGSYPLGSRTINVNTDNATGVVTGATCDIPLNKLAQAIQTYLNLTTPIAIAFGGTGATTQPQALTNILGSSTIPIINGGTGASTAPTARTNLGAAASGANSDITSLSGLTTPLSVAQGGTGANASGATAANNIGALAIASNLSDLSSVPTARTNLGLGTMAVQNANNVSITGGSISGVAVSGYSLTIDSITALRAVSHTSYTRVYLTGYYSAGDGGGGAYYYDPTDSTSSDNGGTIIVASDGGRWKLEFDGPIDIRIFGAKSDGTSDVGSFVNSILALGRTALFPYTPLGWIVNTTITIAANNWVQFENPSVLVKSTSSTAIFRILGASNNVLNPCGLRGGAVFNMQGSGVNSSVILMGTSSQIVASVRIIGKYTCQNCYSFYLEETHASNYVVDVQIEDVYCQYTLGRQFYSKRSRGFFLVRSFIVDHTANNYVSAWEGIRVEDFIGFEGERLDVVGPTPALLTPVYQAVANGMVFSGATGAGQASLYLTRALVDNTYGNGIIISNVNYVQGGMVSAFQNLGFGIQITNCTQVQIERLEQVGGFGVTGASAAQHGIAVSGCNDLQLNNIVANSNTASGVFLHNSLHGVYTNITAKSNQNWGWVEDGTSNLNIKVGMISYNNVSGSLNQVGAGSATCNWIPNSGIFRSSDVGAITV